MTIKRKEKKQRISISLLPSVWKRIQNEADKRDMSASSLAELMFEVGLKKIENEKNKTLKERLAS